MGMREAAVFGGNNGPEGKKTEGGRFTIAKRRSLLHYAFISACFAGLVITADGILKSFSGKPLCAAQGCKIVESYARIGQSGMCAAGFAFFVTLFVLYVLELLQEGKSSEIKQGARKKNKTYTCSLVDVLISSSICAEGFLAAFQVLRAKAVCRVCFAILAIIVSLGVLRWLSDKSKIVLSGFLGAVAVFSAVAVTKPPSATCKIPNAQYVLFYREGCSHCKKVLDECKNCNVNVQALDATKYIELLSALNLKSVPVLFASTGNEKRMIVGEESIRRFLRAASKSGQREKNLAERIQKRTTEVGEQLELFSEMAGRSYKKPLACSIEAGSCK